MGATLRINVGVIASLSDSKVVVTTGVTREREREGELGSGYLIYKVFNVDRRAGNHNGPSEQSFPLG